MARAIDADALIKWLRPYLHTGEAIPADVVIEDIRSMPTLTPPNKWVSVDERLPEDDVPEYKMQIAVLVLTDRGVVKIKNRTYHPEKFYYGKFYPERWDWGTFNDDRITHWMPLPAPPGKGNNVPTNEPLTIEELREMDGEPVYIVFLPDATGEKLQFWALVSVDAWGEVHIRNNLGGSSLYDEVIADIEAIYRRPPEVKEDT